MNLETLRAVLDMTETQDVDFKATFPPYYFDKTQREHQKGRATLIKDVAAMANAQSPQPGFLVYGVKDKGGLRSVVARPTTEREDDATLRSFLNRYLDPAPIFDYGEFPYQGEVVGLLRIQRVPEYPHVVKLPLGDLIYPGQVYYREGTSTHLALHSELRRMFKGHAPIPVDRNHPQVLDLTRALSDHGWHLAWIHEHEVEIRQIEGWFVAYPSGSRRPYRTARDFAHTTWDVLMKRPKDA